MGKLQMFLCQGFHVVLGSSWPVPPTSDEADQLDYYKAAHDAREGQQ